MPFVNEFIPDADVVKYNIEAIDKATFGGSNSRSWTIDRARDMYLRLIRHGRGSDVDLRNQCLFSFYWRHELLTLRLDLIEGGGGRGEPGWSHWRLVRVNGKSHVTGKIEEDDRLFIADLEEALLAFKDFGVYSTNTDYHVILDVDGLRPAAPSPPKKSIWPWRR